jgi:hypothetical protein
LVNLPPNRRELSNKGGRRRGTDIGGAFFPHSQLTQK